MINDPIERRQSALAVLIGKNTPMLRSSPVFEMEPAALLAAVREQGLEGIIAKKAGSLYERIEECPFANLPTRGSRFGGGMTRGAMRHVAWIKPELVCQVRFTEWADDGMLRHPGFLGLRSDKAAKDVVRETPVGGKVVE